MYSSTQTDSATQLSELEERASVLTDELFRVRLLIDSLRNGEANASVCSLCSPQIYLQPLRPYDRLRTKWNLGTGLRIPAVQVEETQAPAGRASTCLRLFGLLADGSPWECRLDFEDIANNGGIFLGRDPEAADMVIPDAGISRCHVKISLSEHGVEVRDQGSTNGTAINGEAFSPYHPNMILQSGDTLTLGDVMLQAEIIRNTSF